MASGSRGLETYVLERGMELNKEKNTVFLYIYKIKLIYLVVIFLALFVSTEVAIFCTDIEIKH
jgi:hypothetical protein